jgi:PIN domain nuclease of toxin-antitoxin system
MLAAAEHLGAAAAVVEDAGNEVRFSAASVWEVAMKASLGRLELPRPAAGCVPVGPRV